jgi:hypothetical protein
MRIKKTGTSAGNRFFCDVTGALLLLRGGYAVRLVLRRHFGFWLALFPHFDKGITLL